MALAFASYGAGSYWKSQRFATVAIYLTIRPEALTDDGFTTDALLAEAARRNIEATKSNDATVYSKTGDDTRMVDSSNDENWGNDRDSFNPDTVVGENQSNTNNNYDPVVHDDDEEPRPIEKSLGVVESPLSVPKPSANTNNGYLERSLGFYADVPKRKKKSREDRQLLERSLGFYADVPKRKKHRVRVADR